jgi:ribulose-5-phosphate 4-epimerase/fuculose-1-phosphate aldolase
MTEEFIGVRFKTVFKNKNLLSDKRIDELIKWGKKLFDLGLSPKFGNRSAGNLSFRTKHGFIITCSGSLKSKLTKKDFIEVVNCDFDNKKVEIKGIRDPSSETFLHFAIYKKRRDVNAIIHMHDLDVLKNARKLKIPETHDKKLYGTVELADEAMKILKNNDYIILKGHGIVAMGKNIEKTGTLVLKKFKEGKRLES